MTVRVEGRTILTTVREFRLLGYLAAHRGRVFTRDQLLDSVWRDTAYVTPRSVDVYVRRIREKIEIDPENPYRYIQIRGRVMRATEEGASAHIDALAKKYLGKDKYPFRQPGELRVMYEIEPGSASGID